MAEELEGPWSVSKHKATDMEEDGVDAEPGSASAAAAAVTPPKPPPARCGGGSRQVLLGWDSFRSRVLLGLLLATVVWAAVYFPLISLA